MSDEKSRPLSLLVSQGWEVIGYSQGVDSGGNHTDGILLRRQKQHKLLKIRKKLMGGYAVSELDV